MTKHKDSSWKNVKRHRAGKESLVNAVLQHPDEDPKTSIYTYVQDQVNKATNWIMSYGRFKEKKGRA